MEYNLNYELIGMRIKNRRLKLKFTQETLAEKIGASIRHISGVENAKTKLSLPCLVLFANALDTTADHLLMDSVAASTPELLGEAKKLFDDCTPEEIFVIIETSKTLKNSIRIKKLRSPEK